MSTTVQGPTPLEIQTQIDAWTQEIAACEAQANDRRGWRSETLAIYLQLHGPELPDGRKIVRVRHGFRLDSPNGRGPRKPKG